MKQIISLVLFATLFAACSSPKYSYRFTPSHHDDGIANQTVAVQNEPTPFEISKESLSASTTSMPATIETKSVALDQKVLREKITSMSKSERKALKKELKSEIKNVIKGKKKLESVEGTNAAKAWDYDLKMAAIFGAVGLVLTALGGVNTVFWVLGAIALIVAVVFLIKWLARQ